MGADLLAHSSLIKETQFLNRRPNVVGFQDRYGVCWRRLPYSEVAEGLMFGKGLTATSHVARLAEFGGREMSFNICRGTLGSLAMFTAYIANAVL